MGLCDLYDPDRAEYVACWGRDSVIPTYCALCRCDVYMPVGRLDADPDATPLCRSCFLRHRRDRLRRAAGLEPEIDPYGE